MPISSIPRALIAAAVVGTLLAAERVDPVAAAVAVAALVMTFLLLRSRRKRTARRAGVGFAVAVTLTGTLAALALPVYRGRPDPLIVPSASTKATSASPERAASGGLYRGGAQSGSTVLGFADTAADETPAGVDRDLADLSVLASTGLRLADSSGRIDVTGNSDGLVRAHLGGAAGYLVVSNDNGTDFDPGRVRALLASSTATRRFVSSLSSIVAKQGWDGVVLDFESLTPDVRASYPTLVEAVATALGSRRVLVAVPAWSGAPGEDYGAYDLQALGHAADSIVWMAYDQHDPTSDAGPIAALPWVRATLQTVTASVPPAKVLLGLGSYAYAWHGNGTDADELTVPAVLAASQAPGAAVHLDATADEWTGSLADGRTVWFEDTAGLADRAALVPELGLGGVALWRVGSEPDGSLAHLGLTPNKRLPVSPDRPVDSEGTGVVALTFDDGPDPRWTPQVLAVLRREHVPATFFVIGAQAEQHPGLVRAEVADGDVVGNHTYSHPNMSRQVVWREQLEILGGAATIEGITGRQPAFFRSPYGAGDDTKRHRGADQIAADRGFHPVGWNVDPQDWAQPGTDEIVGRVLAGTQERSVVLLHDGGGNREQTIAALPKIIEALKARGYVFTTVDGVDASVTGAYRTRHGVASQARGLAIIAMFRLQHAGRHLVLWLLVASALLALLRVALAGPLAARHWWRTRRPRPPVTPFTPLPSVTVLVPAHNEAAVITKTLEALAAGVPVPDEVIVIDDGSTDDTVAIVGTCTSLGDRLRLVTQTNAGKAAALNHGLSRAHGDVVVVIDADTVVDPHLVGAFAVHFTDPRVGAVAGNVKVGNRRKLIAALQALEYIVSLNLDRRAQDVARVMAVVPGAAGAFRRRALEDVGGYPSDTLAEDADLTVALLRRGWRIPYEPRAVAWTEAPEHVRDVVQQRRRWSYGTIQVVDKHKRSLLEPRHGAVGVVGLPWMLMSQVVLPVLGPLADLYLLVLLVHGEVHVVAGILALALGADLVLATAAVAMDHERWRMVGLAPLVRLIWRPLQLAVVIRSALRFAVGSGERWLRIDRYNSVRPGSLTPPTTAVDTMP